uniref:hypothetical protein n=1 Tax=Candidatus Ventrenecus sp. TaxID=3085654 RepID=UPI003FF069C0
MKLEKYKESHRKRKIIYSLVGLILLGLGIFLFYQSYAFYEERKNFDVINGTVEDPGDIYFAYYIDGVISRNMPIQNTGYTLDETKSNCNNNVSVKWDNASWEAKVNYKNYSATTNTRTKCTLYFNKTAKTVKTALGNIEVNSYTPDFTKSACDDSTCESHEKGIYETTDTDGNPTYYYRGSVENNYVKFAGYFWRIIRINSNGSIRMIYDGPSAHQNGESSADRQYGTSQFNTSWDNNMYVGYMYTSGESHGTGTSSTIKTNADKFYTDKLSSYASKLDTNVGFCGDRSNLNNQSGVGTGTVITYNKGYLRVVESTPTLTCENASDYYTVSSASSGNKKLSYPIGLITTDEMMLAGHAGGVFDGLYNHMKTNNGSYLATGNTFWTMTPAGGYNPFGDTYWRAQLFGVYGSGIIDGHGASDTNGLRPVVNLKSDVTITGSGAMTDPYVVA